MGKSNKTKNKKNTVVRRDTVRRGSSTRGSLHYRSDTTLKKSSLDLMPAYVQTRRVRVRKPRDPEPTSFRSRKINYGAFHSPFNLEQLTPKEFVCARRKIRREIIHAIGAGGTKVRKPRYTDKSQIKC